MARTALTPQKFATLGLAPTYVAPDVAGVSLRSSGKQVLHVKNASGSSITVTLKIGKTVEGQAVTAPTATVAAGAEKFFGPFNDNYEQPDGTDTVFVDFSAVTSVTVACLSL
ncbi:hypothetical protein JK361_10085 [Streptomyces sp. 5-8]|uniref:Glycosyl hydrolase family 30 beta sandwich domain-containing protein n=1 Tax=Streptomyces musisoli TaxID=2802280 RepID=A0ABS1NY55_9ACTN|nr:hypothetical protein [Streptomyces musisoli]MBL1104939.1 hypothetical protein [Streptomyces musisoli]